MITGTVNVSEHATATMIAMVAKMSIIFPIIPSECFPIKGLIASLYYCLLLLRTCIINAKQVPITRYSQKFAQKKNE